jgi:3'-phosphoadenosine 5'-phosphosulfate sulfotransferase (PAPS reductase)/FAD synthetase
MRLTMSKQQVLQKQGGQITERYSDGRNGRCAMGVIMSYFGWDGVHDSDITTSLQAALPTLSNGGLRDDFSIIELNDSGMTFDEIADYLDRIDKQYDMVEITDVNHT